MTPRRRRAAVPTLAALWLALETGLAAASLAGPATDMLGRRVVVPEAPRRIVSLAPSMTEIVYALGAGDRLVAVTDHCDFPPEVAKKPTIGGIYNPNFELILAAAPDLVLATSEGNRAEHVRALEALGVPAYVVKPIDFETTLASIGEVGRLLGRDEQAARLAGALRRRAEEIARAVEGARRPRVLYVLWGDPLIVPGRDTLITDLIRRAGGDSITGDEPLPYPRLSVEAALARRPDLVVIAQHGQATIDERLRGWRALSVLPAAREGRVRGVDGDIMHRPGPRLVDGLLALARFFHPERVP